MKSALAKLTPHAIDEPCLLAEHVALHDADDVPAGFLHSLTALDVIGEHRRVGAMAITLVLDRDFLPHVGQVRCTDEPASAVEYGVADHWFRQAGAHQKQAKPGLHG